MPNKKIWLWKPTQAYAASAGQVRKIKDLR